MATNDVRYTLNGGFFNARWSGEDEAPAVTYDRTYDSEDMMQPYINVVTEGIFAYQTNESGGEAQLQVGFPCTVKTNENIVSIQAGRGILNHHWFELDHTENISIATNSSLTNRIDSLIIQCNMNMDERAMYLIYRQGTASAPALETNDTTIFEFRLWNISVPNMNTGTEQITLEDKRGTSECPYITGLLQQLTLDERLNKFDEDVTEKLNSYDQQLLDKIDEFESQGQSAISTFNSNGNEAIESFETESGQKITSFETNSGNAINTFNTTSQQKLTQFDTDSETKLANVDTQLNEKLSTFDEESENALSTFETESQQKLGQYDSQIAQKMQSYDNSMTQIWAEWKSLKAQISASGGVGGGTDLTITRGYQSYTSGTITISDYNAETDTIFLFINGLYANMTNDYELSSAGVITFKNTINSGADIDWWKFTIKNHQGESGDEPPVQGFALSVKSYEGAELEPESDGSYNLLDGVSYFVEATPYLGTYRWEAQSDGSTWTPVADSTEITLVVTGGVYNAVRCIINYNEVDYTSEVLNFKITVSGNVEDPVIKITEDDGYVHFSANANTKTATPKIIVDDN